MEAWKLIIGTVSGFIIAFFSEPVKFYFSKIEKKKQLKESLYREMIQLYSNLQNIIEFCRLGKIHVDQLRVNLENLSCGCYEFTKKDPLLFYELSEATHIDALYKNFYLLFKVHHNDVLAYAEVALSGFEGKVKNDILDRKLDRKSVV